MAKAGGKIKRRVDCAKVGKYSGRATKNPAKGWALPRGLREERDTSRLAARAQKSKHMRGQIYSSYPGRDPPIKGRGSSNSIQHVNWRAVPEQLRVSKGPFMAKSITVSQKGLGILLGPGLPDNDKKKKPSMRRPYIRQKSFGLYGIITTESIHTDMGCRMCRSVACLPQSSNVLRMG